MRQTLIQQLLRLPTSLLPLSIKYLMQCRHSPLIVIPKGEHVNKRSPRIVKSRVVLDHRNTTPDAKVTSLRALTEELGETFGSSVSFGPFHCRGFLGHVAGIVLSLHACLAHGGGCCFRTGVEYDSCIVAFEFSLKFLVCR